MSASKCVKHNSYIGAITRFREILYIFCLCIFGIKKIFFGETLWKVAFPVLVEFEERITEIYKENLISLLWICVIIAFFSLKPNILNYLIAGFLLYVGRCASLIQGDVYFYIGALLVVAAVGLSAKKILVVWLSFNLPILIATIVSSKIGILENWIEVGRNREFLGFVWTTTPVMIFSYAVFEYLVLKRGKLGVFSIVLICSVNIWLFMKTNTRFSFLIIFGVLAVFSLYNNSDGIKRLVVESKSGFVALPWFCCAMVYTASVYYESSNVIMYKVNRVLSNRLAQCNYSFTIYPLKPFGQVIEFVQTRFATPDNPATYVDTAYLQLLLRYGWLALIAFLVVSSMIIWRAYKEERFYIAIVFGIILIFGLFEQQLYWFQFDIILLLAFADWRDLPMCSDRINKIGE